MITANNETVRLTVVRDVRPVLMFAKQCKSMQILSLPLNTFQSCSSTKIEQRDAGMAMQPDAVNGKEAIARRQSFGFVSVFVCCGLVCLSEQATTQKHECNDSTVIIDNNDVMPIDIRHTRVSCATRDSIQRVALCRLRRPLARRTDANLAQTLTNRKLRARFEFKGANKLDVILYTLVSFVFFDGRSLPFPVFSSVSCSTRVTS